MTERRYYSMRTGRNPNLRFDLATLREIFIAIYRDFDEKGYFQEAFGYSCVDAGDVPGSVGSDIEAFVMRKLYKKHLWPIGMNCQSYSEDDLFDVVELLYDYVSQPTDGYYHSFNDCGWHYREFDQGAGKEEFRAEINDVLKDYGEGFQLSTEGEILVIGPVGTDTLLQAQLPEYDEENVNNRVKVAIQQYRSSRSSMDQRRDAVRNLGDVLEFLRPKIKKILKGDESDLFNILNNFGIRHHNDQQKTDYEQSIFLSWLFYHYLAAIHAAIRLIEKHEEQSS